MTKTLNVAADIHKELKIFVVVNSLTMEEVVNEAIAEYLKSKGHKSKK